MTTNDQIILNETLDQRKQEIAPELSASEYFELFAAEQVLKEYDLSYSEIQEGIAGGGGNGGIDSLYVLVNGELVQEDTDLSMFKRDTTIELHIIQAKTSPGFSDLAIQKLKSSTEELLDLSKDLDDLTSVYDARVLSVVTNFRRVYTALASRYPKLKLSYYYVSKGVDIHPNVERQVSLLKQVVERLFSSVDFSFDFIGARELLQLARKSPTTTFNLTLAESPISTGDVSFVCLVSLKEYYKLITEPHGKLRKPIFEANVRDYQGEVQVNKGIEGSLKHPKGEDFWWLNNGITMLASQATLSGRTLTIEDPQIVNGLQTSSEIHKYLADNKDVQDDRNILVRVIVPKDPGSRDRIIQATNSQTSIPVASLRAADPIHLNIEDFLKSRGYYYDRRKNFYKNEGKPANRILSIGYMAQVVMAIVLKRPDDARARPSTLIKNPDVYSEVFNESYPIHLFLRCVEIMKRVEEYLRSRSPSIAVKDVNNIKFHLAMFAALLLANDRLAQPTTIADLPLSGLDDSFLDTCFHEVWSVYQAMGADDQVAKGKEFVQRLRQRLDALTYKGRLTRPSAQGGR